MVPQRIIVPRWQVKPRLAGRTSCEMMLRSRPQAQIGERAHGSAPPLPWIASARAPLAGGCVAAAWKNAGIETTVVADLQHQLGLAQALAKLLAFFNVHT